MASACANCVTVDHIHGGELFTFWLFVVVGALLMYWAYKL